VKEVVEKVKLSEEDQKEFDLAIETAKGIERVQNAQAQDEDVKLMALARDGLDADIKAYHKKLVRERILQHAALISELDEPEKVLSAEEAAKKHAREERARAIVDKDEYGARLAEVMWPVTSYEEKLMALKAQKAEELQEQRRLASLKAVEERELQAIRDAPPREMKRRLAARERRLAADEEDAEFGEDEYDALVEDVEHEDTEDQPLFLD